MLTWDPSFAIGVTEIDAQHRSLFERAIRLEAAVQAGEAGIRLEELFTFLADYARSHFAAEERLMRAAGYPGLAAHAQEHSEFRRKLQSLVPHWESEGDSTALLAALLGFLDYWLTDHVASSDQGIGDHVRSLAGLPPLGTSG
jgi:hemerythrin